MGAIFPGHCLIIIDEPQDGSNISFTFFVVAPLLDELRPSRKENAIGTMRPYQNAHTGISSQ